MPRPRAEPWRHVVVLVGAGVVTGVGQFVLTRLSSGNGIDITAAIWFYAGRLPALRTLAQRALSVVIVGMGASLGREGAPKQAGAVIANAAVRPRRAVRRAAAAAGRLRRGRGNGRGLRRAARRRAVRARGAARHARAPFRAAGAGDRRWWRPPSPGCSCPTRRPTTSPPSRLAVELAWALVAGPIAGLCRSATSAPSPGPTATTRAAGGAWSRRSWRSASLGAVSIPFPQLLGNGRDVAELAFTGGVAPVAVARCCCCARRRRSCASAAARRAGCSRRRSRWARCSAARSGSHGRGSGPACRPACSR